MFIFVRVNGLEQKPCASMRLYSVLKLWIHVCHCSYCPLFVQYMHITQFCIYSVTPVKIRNKTNPSQMVKALSCENKQRDSVSRWADA